MKILITGACGQLGRTLIDVLSSNYELILTDISNHQQSNSDSQTIMLDITEIDQVKNIVGKFKPDVIINTAAVTNVDGCETQKGVAQRVNVDGVKNIAKVAKDCSLIIHISTDYVFDGVSGYYSENDAPNPQSYYGITKLEAERFIEENNENYVILRPNVLYGPSEYSVASFFAWVYSSLTNGQKINVVTDQISNPTYSFHFAEVIEKCIKNDARGIYHYGSSNYLSRLEFSYQIAEIFNFDKNMITPILTKDLMQKAPRPLNSSLITEKIQTELDVKTFDTEYCLQQIKKLMGKT